MYIGVSNLRELLESIQSNKALVQDKDLIDYDDWKELKRLSQDDCLSCGGCPSDREYYLDFQIDTNNKDVVLFQCNSCYKVTPIHSEMFAFLMREHSNKGSADFSSWNTHITARRMLELKKKDEKEKIKKLVEECKELDKKTNKNIKGEEENDNMMNTNKMFKGLDFGKVDTSKFRLSHLGLAIQNREGVFVSYDKANEQLLDVDLFDFDLDGMIYKMPVSHNQVSAGDVIMHNGKPVLVTDSTNANLNVIDPVAGEVKIIMPTKNMFGFNFFTKIICLMDMSNSGASSDNPFGNMMPLLMMSSMSEGKGNNDMMTMMMMSQMMGGNNQMGDMFSNPMMMMAMMSGEGKGMSEMLPMMMMMQGGMFGQQPQQNVNNNTNGEVGF